MYREILDDQRRVEGENGRNTFTTQGALGRSLAVLGRYEESEALQAVGRFGESETVLAEAQGLFEEALPGDHPDLVRTRQMILRAPSATTN